MFLRFAGAILRPQAISEVAQNLVSQNRLLRQPNWFRGSGNRGSSSTQKMGTRFQIVHDKRTTDLIFLLSADPYNGGHIIFASGQAGTMASDGHIEQDRVPITIGWLRCEMPT